MILQRIDPTTRLLALAVLTTPLLLSIDLTSATVALIGIILLAPLCGTGPVELIRRGWPLLLLAPLTGLSMLLYGRAGGEVYVDAGLITITQNSVALAVAVTVRVLAVGLPAVILTRNLDPTRLGDGLAQLWKLPARFVIGSVAGVRMATLFQQDWAALERARRARGLGDGSRISRLPKQMFALLVLALRRGGKLATAMEARGFGATDANRNPLPRTWGRKATFGAWDIGVLLVCAALSVLALGIAVWTGDFRLLGVTGS
ncbi:energy-coupling factor transporter transmembrane component T family protein [Corynebacterium auriscanis]|uniref:energy-coupling factor transporter transmembrane component T family protein n=1 Tax=Corynebacterium auriscanis TaxID=99807 RepID=UPI003CF7E797